MTPQQHRIALDWLNESGRAILCDRALSPAKKRDALIDISKQYGDHIGKVEGISRQVVGKLGRPEVKKVERDTRTNIQKAHDMSVAEIVKWASLPGTELTAQDVDDLIVDLAKSSGMSVVDFITKDDDGIALKQARMVLIMKGAPARAPQPAPENVIAKLGPPKSKPFHGLEKLADHIRGQEAALGRTLSPAQAMNMAINSPEGMELFRQDRDARMVGPYG